MKQIDKIIQDYNKSQVKDFYDDLKNKHKHFDENNLCHRCGKKKHGDYCNN